MNARVHLAVVTGILTNLAIAVSLTPAETKVALPAGGYYRVGELMPVRVTTDAPVTIRADGALRTEIIPGAAPFDAEVPLLILRGQPSAITYTVGGVEHTLDQPLALNREPRAKTIGPDGAQIGEMFYQPIAGWQVGRSPEFRRAIVFAGVIFAILMLAVTLWRSRWNLLAAAIVAVLCSGAVLAWASREMAVVRQRCEIFSGTQRDEWTWLASLAPTETRFAIDGPTWPVLASSAHAEQIDLHIRCANGRSDYAFSLGGPRRIAFLRRSGNAPPPPATRATQPSSLVDFAKNVYAGPGDVAAVAEDGDVPVIVIGRPR